MLRDRFRFTLLVFGLLLAAVPQTAWTQPVVPIPVPMPGAEPVPDPAEPFFDDNVVHDIKLAINERDWESLKVNYLDNTVYICNFQVDNQPLVRNVGIRSRGLGSRSGVKPGLRVDFDYYSTSQKFLGLKSVVLRNNTQDPSHLRERLSMAFFRRMGVPAPREAHARLFVNNEYAGLYTIVESIDKTFLKRTFGENDGYLFDYDYAVDDEPYFFDYRGAEFERYVPKPFKPETHERDPHPEVIERMVWTIKNANDAIFPEAVSEFVDVVGFLRHVAVEVFLADQDGLMGDWGMNNFYMYRPPDANTFRLIAWDKSQAFHSPDYSIWRNIYDVTGSRQNRLVTRLLEYDSYRELYLETLLECGRLAAELPEAAGDDQRGWFERELDRQYLQIRDAVLADDLKPYPNAHFEAAIEANRVFARDRRAYVNAEVEEARRRGRVAVAVGALGRSGR